jgi:hypothetical protein
VPFWHAELLRDRAPAHLLIETNWIGKPVSINVECEHDLVCVEGGHHNDIEASFSDVWVTSLHRLLHSDIHAASSSWLSTSSNAAL